ncbi:MAG: hypothetical protein J3R72DRAFT_487517 [Linnemannia gamsii]|nr:MAG: hypothetical protein J3R72DRAFT_487517 [Linnemannia gamsii]
MTTVDPLPHYKYVDWNKPDMVFRMYIGYVSLVFDLRVLAYHFATPSHPKFYVKTARRRALRTHIISGCLEIIACVCAFYSENPTKYAYAAAAFGALAHVPSTFYQIPTVLGIKAFLVPSLGMVAALHGYFAVSLVLNPTSFYYLLSTYLTIHIYAWSRVFFALYYRFKLLEEHPRELAADPEKKVVLEALVTAAEVVNAIESLSLHDTKDRYSRICATVMTANARSTTPREKAHAVFRAIDVNKDNELSIAEFKDFLVACGMSPYGTEGKLLLDGLFQDRKAKLVFDALDADGSGELDLVELETLLTSWGLPRDEAIGYLKSHDKDQSGTIEFQEFYSSMGTVWKFAIQSFIDEGKIRTEE